MALLRKIFFRKPPDGLFEISERVYVFDYCFTTDVVEDDSYKTYIGGIASQLRTYFPEGSFLVFNFREGEGQSQIANILSDHEMTVMDYPRQYEGCPLLTMEVIHHFLRSSESWLLVGQHNVLLMHCERGGWPILAFMLAGLLIYRKQYAAEQKILNMIHKQAPHELLRMFSPLNPLPSQLRYLRYISRRNLSSEWPPKDRDLTLDCIILRSIPNMDGKGGCRPILRIYGQDPLLASDPSPKVLFSIPKKSKLVRQYKQVECGLVKIDVNCHIKGDVLLECINLDDDLQHESTMFRIMLNTAFIRSNISMLSIDEIDTLWDAKDLFPKEFRAEVIFSEMDAPISSAAISLPAILDKEELPCDAFAKVHEFFNNVDWMDPKPDVSLNVIDQITISAPLREKSPSVRDLTDACSIEDSSHSELEEKLMSQTCGKQGLPVEALHTDLIQEKLDPLHTMALAVIKGMTTPSSGQKAANVESSNLQTPKGMQSSDTSENSIESSPAMVLENQKAASEPCSDATLIKENAEPHMKNASPVWQCNKERPPEREKPPLDASDADMLNRKKTSQESDGKFKHSTPKDLENQSSIIESAPQKLHDKPKSQTLETISSSPSTALQKQSKPPSGTPPDTISNKTKTQPEGLLPALQKPPVSKIISPRFSQSPHSGPIQKSSSLPCSPPSVSRYRGASPSLGITTILDGSSQSSVESPSLVNKTRSVQSSPQSPISSPPAPPPPPVSSWQHPDASVAAELSPLSSRSGLGNSSDDQHDITPVKRKTAPSLLSSRKTSPEPPASLSHPPSKLPLPPPPPPPPCSCAAGSSDSPGSAPPLPVLPPSIRIVSKPPPPLPPPPANAKSGGTTTTTPIPPPLPPIASASISSTSSEVPQPPPPPNVSITSPRSGIPPPFPPAPAPPSAQGFSNGSPQPPPVPGSNGPVPPAPGPPLSKGRALTRSPAKNTNQSKKTTLKPYHWLKLNRVVQGSLWAEAQKTGEVSQAPEFDMSELENLFSASAPKSKSRGLGGKSNSGGSGPKSDKIQLIELRRAYNCEIMLSKVKVPLPDLMNSVLALDDTGLDIDQVENLIKFCPTKEEMELLKGYKGDKENLGKCEQFFLELMKVPRVESKLRVFCFKMQFTSQVSDLRKNLNTINSTSEEVRGSEKLRRIMHTILQLGNALNQGTTRGSAVGFRLDSLLKLTDTRARNSKMTLMHYLCKVLAEKLPDLLDFPQDLVSLEASTKIQLKILAEEMQAISKGLEKLAQELTASQNDGPVSETFCKLLKVFLSHAEGEVRSLASLYSHVGRNADALAMYFGEDPAKCPFEQVVSTLLNFSRMFTRAHEENCKQLEFEKKKAEKEAEKEK